jgi:hypothetical protein
MDDSLSRFFVPHYENVILLASQQGKDEPPGVYSRIFSATILCLAASIVFGILFGLFYIASFG